MEVILAGYNVDAQILARLRRTAARPDSPAEAIPLDHPKIEPEIDPESLTPETLSAAYARASRDPRPLPELRAEALYDVANARRSNERIVFGFGHASVAEHAVFNIDILGLSRLATEALEGSRLGSYTEKSQRYIRLDRDAIVPSETAGGPLENAFRRLLDQQQCGYQHACDTIVAHYQRERAAEWNDRKSRALLEGSAKEDARYFLGLATTGQIGATLNGRSLEATVGRLASHPLAEARELAAKLHAAVADIAPSLVVRGEPSAYRQETPRDIADFLARGGFVDSPLAADVGLIDVTGSEDVLLAALVHGHSQVSWEQARRLVADLSERKRLDLVAIALSRLTAYDALLRQFELPVFTFELIVSASCFAQLKRHRMATILAQDYDPRLGVTLPAVFAMAGLQDAYEEVRAQSEEMHAAIRAAGHAAPVADYALTNGHRRRLIFQADAREMYHLSRLRMDAHAQWDIRQLVTEMVRQARERMPLTMMLAGGKDAFNDLRANLSR